MLETEYGEHPYKKVRVVEVSIHGMKRIEDAQFIQYNLMLKDGVILVKINQPTGRGEIIVRSDVKNEDILKAIESIKTYDCEGKYTADILNEREIDYVKDVVSKMYRI